MRFFSVAGFAIAVLLLLPKPGLGQAAADSIATDSNKVRQIRYERLDKIEFDQASFFSGEEAQVGFYLVELENLTSGQTVQGVEVQVSRLENKQVGGSLALGSVGSLFGSNASVTYRRIQESGHYFLPPPQIGEVVQFLDSVVQNLGQTQNRLAVWKVSIRDNFELGMQYDPSASSSSDEAMRPEWSFVVTAGDASYRLDYQSGISVIRKLSKWDSRLN